MRTRSAFLAAPLLAFAALSGGCVSKRVHASAQSLRRGLTVYRASSRPKPGVNPDAHRALGKALQRHVDALEELTK